MEKTSLALLKFPALFEGSRICTCQIYTNRRKLKIDLYKVENMNKKNFCHRSACNEYVPFASDSNHV